MPLSQTSRGRSVNGKQGGRWLVDEEKRSKGAETPLICRGKERVSCLCFPYQNHSSESFTCSSYSHHNNLHTSTVCVSVCVNVHICSPTVNSNKQQGMIKYVCQVKDIIDFPSRPLITTTWIMTCINLHSTLSSTLVREGILSVRNNWKLFQSVEGPSVGVD